MYSSLSRLQAALFFYAVIFDPASFYGHHEFEFSIPRMFAGFNEQFFDAYHKCIPKAPGFAVRHKLYTLFNYINHWYAIILLYICRPL